MSNTAILNKLNIAIPIVKQAGALSLHYFKQLAYSVGSVSIKEKQHLDFVSEADIAVEKVLISALTKAFPKDSYIGEESSFQNQNNPASADPSASSNAIDGYWVIDPIDGTTNFINGLDDWCISVAYYSIQAQAATIGMIYQPTHNRLFASARGFGVTLNGTPLPRIDAPLSAMQNKYAIIGVGTSSLAPTELVATISGFIRELGCSRRKISCCALMLSAVVTGSYRGYFEPKINSWDCLAGLMMIKELGGTTNDFLANNGIFNGNVLMAAHPAFYPKLLPLLEKCAQFSPKILA